MARRELDALGRFAEAGLDGCVLSWVNYEAGLRQWSAEIMPLLEQAGLRKPYCAPA
jgi:FMNH2-dependent dimethyl sulfone monooxygenase